MKRPHLKTPLRIQRRQRNKSQLHFELPKGAHGRPMHRFRTPERRDGRGKHTVKILAGLTLGLASAPVHAQECYNRLTQDLSCNAVDATDEVAVDLEDPTCAGTWMRTATPTQMLTSMLSTSPSAAST